jgi:hypothetical protein
MALECGAIFCRLCFSSPLNVSTALRDVREVIRPSRLLKNDIRYICKGNETIQQQGRLLQKNKEKMPKIVMSSRSAENVASGS